jgi:polysaccharide deacetylase family protein (PEP-CTERM system associated)
MGTSAMSPVQNAVTVDVEDYFQVSAFRKRVPFENWPQQASRVERNTRRVLELMAEFDLHGTFFVLGWAAERYPSLVREILSAGHDLGCHSYAHRLVYEMTPAEFRDDTRRARLAIEDAAGIAVHAYRAPSFSITERSLWALEILIELGFTVDSSIFPTRNYLYGIPTAPRQPFRIRINGSDLLECPLATLRLGTWGVPVTGGVYLRVLPYRLQALGLNALAGRGVPIVLYFHSWELDPDQPRVAAALGPKFYHYMGLTRTESRLGRLFARFAFGPLSQFAATGTPVYEAALADLPRGKRVVFTPLSAH